MLLAVLLGVSLTLGACSDRAAVDDPAPGTSGSADEETASATPGPGAGADGSADEPSETAAPVEPLTVAGNPYLPACRLFPPAQAIKLLPFTEEGEFTQEGPAFSVPTEEVRELGSVTTDCHYSLDDADNTVVGLSADLHVDEKSARQAWMKIKRYGEMRLPPSLTDGKSDFSGMELSLIHI